MGYLQEDFHFTPYSIISYMVLGARGQQAVANGQKPAISISMPPFLDSDGISDVPNGSGSATRKRKRDAEKREASVSEDDDVICL